MWWESSIQFSLPAFLLSHLKWWMNDGPVYSYIWLRCTKHIFPGCCLKETEHIRNNFLKSYSEGKTSTQAHICTLSWKICLTVFGAVPEPLAEEAQKWREVSSRFFLTAVESRGREETTSQHIHWEEPGSMGTFMKKGGAGTAPRNKTAVHLLTEDTCPTELSLAKTLK